MYDAGKIIPGLLIFMILMTFPFWYDLVGGVAPMENPVVQTADVPGKDRCVRPTDYMRSQHMELLNEWRDEVVRHDERFTEDAYGRKIEKSLTNTCLDCHANKENFCDRCHNEMAVSPYCWSCHVTPPEVSGTEMAQYFGGQEEN